MYRLLKKRADEITRALGADDERLIEDPTTIQSE
jgi:hypothetical protein